MIKADADSTLLQRFIDTFNRLDGSLYTPADPPAEAFDAGIDPDDWNWIRWQPARWSTSPDAIAAVRIVGPLPALYETLALSYRWPEVDLRLLRLLPNEPAGDLQPLAGAMFADPVLSHTLLSAGFVRFALAAENYDPICFDLKQLTGGDCPIVRFKHESILRHDSIGRPRILFRSFRELVLAVISLGDELTGLTVG